jgi:hypothetical protein
MCTLIYDKIKFLCRKILRNLAIIIAFCSGSFVSLAQEPDQVTAAIDKLLNNYKPLGDFSADFTQTKKLVALGMELNGKGQLQVYTDKSIVWLIKEPAPMNVRIDAKEIVIKTTVSGKEQKQVFSLTEGIAGNQIAASVKPFLDLFSGSSTALRERFTITKLDSGYSLTPKEHLPIKTLELIPDSTGTFMETVVIHEKSGDSISYLFTKPASLVKQ